jgi:hypothetical protein
MGIPGVALRLDPEGRLATSLGATTSGSLTISDGAGRVRFFGGVTSGRGAVGESPSLLAARESLAVAGGIDAEIDASESSEIAIATMPVFGCALVGADACSGGEGATADADRVNDTNEMEAP